jgi:uncharacterized protein (DUF342 family)
MMHCLLNVDKKVWVGKQDRANGKLIGGYIDAGEGVYAGTIGATAGTKTLIKYHKYLDEIKEQQQIINAKVNENKAKVDELTKTIEQIKKMPSSEKVKEILGKAVNTYQHYATILGDLMLEVELAEQRFVDCQNSVTVNATEKLFHGVEVHIGDFFERSRREYGPSKFIYKERKVIIDPIVNN